MGVENPPLKPQKLYNPRTAGAEIGRGFGPAGGPVAARELPSGDPGLQEEAGAAGGRTLAFPSFSAFLRRLT